MLQHLSKIAALLPNTDLKSFREALLDWFATQQRDLPWRRNRDPYAVWISEIMLQQTRVSAVIPYYERFMARFPDFESLARAAEAEVLAHWSGLGYYYRARNMQKAAIEMLASGKFPDDHAAIRALPGIGDYTAAAVASISFDLPHAVLDGNVFRVLSRLFADGTNIASLTGKRHFAGLADGLLDTSQPGNFNQAMMELGATVCLPKNPQCLVCPVAEFCRARKSGTQADFPVKIVQRKSVQEQRTLFWIERENRILAWQRSAASSLMPGFWELPEREQLPGATLTEKLGSFKHGITFHSYTFDVWAGAVPSETHACEWISLAELKRLPVSTVLNKAARVVNAARKSTATARSAAASC